MDENKELTLVEKVEAEAKDGEQVISMTYDVPKEINEIQLVFNNLPKPFNANSFFKKKIC